MGILRSEVLRQAAAILETLDPATTERLREDALRELESWDGVEIQFVGDHATSPDCSVAGGYLYDVTPPTLVVAQTTSRRRQQFTVLHELAHHLQRNSIDLLEKLMESADPDLLEEAACDSFAGRVLLPDELVSRHIGPRGPSASDIAALYEESQASRAACCVRAAEKLASPGAVFLVDRAGIVNFAIGKGLAPPARGSDQSATALVAAAIRHEGASRRDTQIRYRDGSTSDTLYGDCELMGGWMVAVVVQDRAAWESFAPARPQTARRQGQWWTCEYCHEEFPTFGVARCAQCNQPRCPSGHCGCTGAKEKTCTSCWLVKGAAQFAPGDSACSDCRGR